MARAAAKRRNDPQGLRSRLLDVAAAGFQARGYHATGMHDIMAQAGATGGALHHHFPTKKALGLAVIRERVAPEVASTWIAPVQTGASVAGEVAAVFRATAAELERRGEVQGCPLNNLVLELSLADPDFRTALQEIFDAWRDAIATRLRKEGAADPAALATLVVAAFSGAMAQAKAAQNVAPLRACARQLAFLLSPTGTGGLKRPRHGTR